MQTSLHVAGMLQGSNQCTLTFMEAMTCLYPWFADEEGQSLECLVFPSSLGSEGHFFVSLWFLLHPPSGEIVIFSSRQLKEHARCLESGDNTPRRSTGTMALESTIVLSGGGWLHLWIAPLQAQGLELAQERVGLVACAGPFSQPA